MIFSKYRFSNQSISASISSSSRTVADKTGTSSSKYVSVSAVDDISFNKDTVVPGNFNTLSLG